MLRSIVSADSLNWSATFLSPWIREMSLFDLISDTNHCNKCSFLSVLSLVVIVGVLSSVTIAAVIKRKMSAKTSDDCSKRI